MSWPSSCCRTTFILSGRCRPLMPTFRPVGGASRKSSPATTSAAEVPNRIDRPTASNGTSGPFGSGDFGNTPAGTRTTSAGASMTFIGTRSSMDSRMPSAIGLGPHSVGLWKRAIIRRIGALRTRVSTSRPQSGCELIASRGADSPCRAGRAERQRRAEPPAGASQSRGCLPWRDAARKPRGFDAGAGAEPWGVEVGQHNRENPAGSTPGPAGRRVAGAPLDPPYGTSP